MSEKLNLSSKENNLESLPPAERFRVDVSDYPLFRQQVVQRPAKDHLESEVWNIDRTVSTYVTDTADLISAIDGTAEYSITDPYHEKEFKGVKADHVLYLDKSARPVSWLVNMFWDDFSEEERPEHSYLNIDRLRMLDFAGISHREGYVAEPSGAMHRATFADFEKEADKLPLEVFAGIRAQYIDGGIDTEDPEEIMKMPTKLDGKNLLIVDEVADTGLTMEMSKYMLKKAIPELKSVHGTYFWDAGKSKLQNGDTQQLSVPVWYNSTHSDGRGIADIDESYYQKKFEENPTSRNRARKMGAFALSVPKNLETEHGQRSRELAREMRKMQEDYQDGRIFVRRPMRWGQERVMKMLQDEGVAVGVGADRNSPNFYPNVVQEIDSRNP